MYTRIRCTEALTGKSIPKSFVQRVWSSRVVRYGGSLLEHDSQSIHSEEIPLCGAGSFPIFNPSSLYHHLPAILIEDLDGWCPLISRSPRLSPRAYKCWPPQSSDNFPGPRSPYKGILKVRGAQLNSVGPHVFEGQIPRPTPNHSWRTRPGGWPLQLSSDTKYIGTSRPRGDDTSAPACSPKDQVWKTHHG